MAERPPTVAWISYFPIEWLPELPESLRSLPKTHPATWQRVLIDELKGHADLKIHVLAVRRQFSVNCTFDWAGVTFHCLKLPRGMRTLSLFWWETMLIRRCLKQIRPDMVHAWGSERAASLVASRLGYPYLVTMQGLLQWYSQQVKMDYYTRLEARLERIGLRRASVVTTESRFAVNWLKDHYPHLEVCQAEHAPNWLFHQLQRQPATQPLQFLFVGAPSQIKGTDLLLLGLDRLKEELDFRLTIVGTPHPSFPLQQLKERTASLWSRVNLRQGLTQAQVGEEMTRATMVLFPTRADTSPNSIKESVVAGLPVVASAVGGILDYVLPGRNGITFPAKDLEAFVSAVRAAAAHPLFSKGNVDPAALAQMREYLSPRTMAARFRSAYQRVLERARSKSGLPLDVPPG
jgi:glycosyltransferase involved in cell wall biosynthesis